MIKKHKYIVDEFLVNGRNGRQAVLKICPTNKRAERYWWEINQRQEVSEYRIAEEERLAEYYRVTKEKIMDKLVRLEESTTSDMVKTRCIELQAKIAGHLSDNKSLIIASANVHPTVSDEELTEKVREEMKKEGKEEVN